MTGTTRVRPKEFAKRLGFVLAIKNPHDLSVTGVIGLAGIERIVAWWKATNG